MSTFPITLKTARSRPLATILTAAAALIAVGVAVLFLALGSADRGRITAKGQPAPTHHAPIHYRDSGRVPAALNPETGQLHGGARAFAPQAQASAPTSVMKHTSYGAVP